MRIRDFMDVVQRLDEKVFAKAIDGFGLEVSIHENPPRAMIEKLLAESLDVRMIIESDTTVFMWDGMDLTHGDVVDQLGLDGIECHMRRSVVEIDNVYYKDVADHASKVVPSIKANAFLRRYFGGEPTVQINSDYY